MGGFLEELPLLTVMLTVQIVLLFIWLLLTSIIWSFSPSNHTGSLIITLFALYSLFGVITAEIAENEENSQADTCSRVRGMLSSARLTLSRPLPPPTAYKTDGLPGLMSL